jgi:hypothetical protein
VKTVAAIIAKNKTGLPRKHPPKPKQNQIHQIAHSLFNQLTVINLCSAKLSDLLPDSIAPKIANDLAMLEQAAEDASKLAEQLSELITEPPLGSEPQRQCRDEIARQRNNILRLL